MASSRQSPGAIIIVACLLLIPIFGALARFAADISVDGRLICGSSGRPIPNATVELLVQRFGNLTERLAQTRTSDFGAFHLDGDASSPSEQPTFCLGFETALCNEETFSPLYCAFPQQLRVQLNAVFVCNSTTRSCQPER